MTQEQQKLEMDVDNLKESFRIDEIDALYDEYYQIADELEHTDEEKVAGTIYACMKTVSIPVLYGEFDVYQNVDTDNVKDIVKYIETEDEFEEGELTNQGTWDYVFFDLNNNNVTAHAENFAQQLVEFYKENDEYKERLDNWSAEVGAMATMFLYRNVTPEATGPANHIPINKTPLLIDESGYDMWDVVECYYDVYESFDKTPSLTYNAIDSSGTLNYAVQILDDLDITGVKRDNIMYLLLAINPDVVEYDNNTTAIVFLNEYSDISIETLTSVSTVNEKQFERIREKTDVENLIY